MKNKEIEELLNDMRHSYKIHEEIIKKYNNADKISYPYRISLKQVNLLLSYIEKLKKENETLGEIVNIKNEQLEEMQIQKTDYTALNVLEAKIKQLENNRDKAIEYLEKSKLNQLDTHCKYLHIDFDCEKIENIDELIDILKGDSDD